MSKKINLALFLEENRATTYAYHGRICTHMLLLHFFPIFLATVTMFGQLNVLWQKKPKMGEESSRVGGSKGELSKAL